MDTSSLSMDPMVQEAKAARACAPKLYLPAALGQVRSGQVRSGQVYYSAEVEDHESHKAAYATSEPEHRPSGLKSSYARMCQ
jgi:hypothetical protein